YDIWLKELEQYNPVMFTGSETTAQKDANKVRFIEDPDCKVLILSLLSGAGVDGWQYVCANMVFGELDWSPHVMDQLTHRIKRPGQTRHCRAFYLTVADGADPFMMSVLNVKRSQHEGLVEGRADEAHVLEGATFDAERVRE